MAVITVVIIEPNITTAIIAIILTIARNILGTNSLSPKVPKFDAYLLIE